MMMLVVVVCSCLAGAVLPANDVPDLDHRFKRPYAGHWMGADQLGRDVFTRGIRAMSRSVSIAVAAFVLAFALGSCLGSVGALFEGQLSGRLVEGIIATIYSMPLLLKVLVGVMSLVGHGPVAAYAIVTLVAWVPVARYVRTLVREALHARFTIAAREMGFGTVDLARHILIPSVYRPVLAASLCQLPELIAIDAALSLFGFGPPPPTPTIGVMIMDGLQHLAHAPWIVAWPAGLLTVTSLTLPLFSSAYESKFRHSYPRVITRKPAFSENHRRTSRHSDPDWVLSKSSRKGLAA